MSIWSTFEAVLTFLYMCTLDRAAASMTERLSVQHMLRLKQRNTISYTEAQSGTMGIPLKFKGVTYSYANKMLPIAR